MYVLWRYTFDNNMPDMLAIYQMSTKKIIIGVILSGCGNKDGSEIHESVLTMLAIDQLGASSLCFAPNIDQHHVTNHATGKETQEKRNILVEAARIARGKISPLKEFDARTVDAVIFPGGLGAATTLSNFAYEGASCTVHKDVERVIREMSVLKKPMGALCIAPPLFARVLDKPAITIGNDQTTQSKLESMGAEHKNTVSGEIAIDRKQNLVTSPCYMHNTSIATIAVETKKVVEAIIGLIGKD